MSPIGAAFRVERGLELCDLHANPLPPRRTLDAIARVLPDHALPGSLPPARSVQNPIDEASQASRRIGTILNRARLLAWLFAFTVPGVFIVFVMQPRTDEMLRMFTRCQDAVRSEFTLAKNVTVDEGLRPANGHPHVSTYQGQRIVGLSREAPDPAYYSPLSAPLSGTYVVSGSVVSGSGPGARFQSYRCKIFVKPPLYYVRDVDVYDSK